jgi:glutamyl-tRNA synthetase
MSITAYREMGYLPDAVMNYLVRLGWSHGDQEFFHRGELIEKFDLAHIGRSAGVFDPEKLLALNADHIQAAQPAALAVQLRPFLDAKGIGATTDYLERAIQTLIQRSKTLQEMADGAEFYFLDNVDYDEKAAAKFLKAAALAPIEALIAELDKLDVFDEQHLEEAFQQVMTQTGLKLGKIAQPVRVALTGKTFSPGIFEIIDVLGRDRTLARLRAAVAFLAAKAAAV